MPDWIEKRISEIRNSEDWLLEEDDPERHARDELEIEMLVVCRKMSLQQRCDLLRKMYHSTS